MSKQFVALAVFVLLVSILGCVPVSARVSSAGAGTPIAQVSTSVPVQPEASPTATAALPAATRPVAVKDASWLSYRNDQAGFGIQYPSEWKFSELPPENAGLRKGVRIEGAEGGIELDWGQGFGGMCEEDGVRKYIKIQAAQGSLQTCYFKDANGIEQWNQISTPNLRPGFQARAWTNDGRATSGELVLKVIATLTFDQP